MISHVGQMTRDSTMARDTVVLSNQATNPSMACGAQRYAIRRPAVMAAAHNSSESVARRVMRDARLASALGSAAARVTVVRIIAVVTSASPMSVSLI